MSKSAKSFLILTLIAVFVFGSIYLVISLTENSGKSDKEISNESAEKKLEKIYNSITVNPMPPAMGSVDLEESDMKDSLADISKYPPQCDNTTEDFVEIFSSTEKAGSDTDGWLVDVANAFNSAGIEVNGKQVSVRIRGIASGLGSDYISSGKYQPDAFSPSNELWGEMLKAKGVEVNLVEERLTGNVTGMLFSREKHDAIIQKYGAVNLKNVIEAVENKEIAMGYTNPFASSAGLNFLVSTLYTYDTKNPLSETSVAGFEKFQTNIPFVAYTTLQMRESAKSGALDGFILEYQSYSNSPELKSDYIFTPYGVRHDSPVYEIGNLSADKKEILKQFIDFCKKEEHQNLASEYGFNNMDDYKSESGKFSGDVIAQSQKIWKEKKDVGGEVVAVFVADTSGSMAGEPINALKQSLQKGSKYIGKDNSVGLISFSDDVNIHVPIGKFDTNQRALFTGAVQNLQAEGNTAMFDAIAVASKMLKEEKDNNPNAKLMLFVLTDGETNRGHSLNDLEGIIKTFKIPIYTIGYNVDDSLMSVLENISNLNEAPSINADTEDVVYKLEALFNAQM